MTDVVRLAYRDNDRTPVIYCIAEMARRHYALDVEVLRIAGGKEYEEALFEGACDVIIEHLEYLYAEASRGRKSTMFCAPVVDTDSEMVVRSEVKDVSELQGQKIAVRAQGRPHAVVLRLQHMGLDATPVVVPDEEVGRWAQWQKVVSGECAATFVSDLYMPAALAAGLKVLATPNLPMVGQFSQACLPSFARANDELMRRYVSAVIHALCLMQLRPGAAMEIVSGEPMALLKVESIEEMERRFHSVRSRLQIKPYPTPEAIANTYQIACQEWPPDMPVNPLTLWDLHWVKQLDDEGFIDGLVLEMSR